MIARVWRGWTAHQNADALEAIIRTETIPNMLSKDIAGLREAQVFRLERLGETEFIMILWFDDLGAVRALAVARGSSEEDYEKSIVSQRARELSASRWVVVSRKATDHAALLRRGGWSVLPPSAPVRMWTDDFSDVLSVFRWKRTT